MFDRNGIARIALAVPFGNRRPVLELEFALLHEYARERRRYTLSLRPGDLGRVIRPPGCVPFAEDLAAIRDDDGTRVVLGLRHHPIEGVVQLDRIDLIEARIGANVTGRPRGRRGIWNVPLDRSRRKQHVIHADRENRASLIPVVFGGPLLESRPPDARVLLLQVDVPLHVVLPCEVLREAFDVFLEHELGCALVVAADDERARTEVMRSHGGNVVADFGVVPGDLLGGNGRDKSNHSPWAPRR